MFDMSVQRNSPASSEHTIAYCFSDDIEYVVWFMARRHRLVIEASYHEVLPNGRIESSSPDDDYYQEYHFS